MTDFGISGNVFFGGTPIHPVIPTSDLDLSDPQPVRLCTCVPKDVKILTDGAIIYWDIALNYNAKVVLQGNREIVIENVRHGDSGTLIVEQDQVGSRTLTFPANSLFEGGISSLTTTPGATDVLAFLYDGINYYWIIGDTFS